MKDELMDLTRKINYILASKEIPEDTRKKIENIYQDYRNFYEQYLKEDIKIASQGIANIDIEEYFEGNCIEANRQIKLKYEEKCNRKMEIIATVLSKLESKEDETIKLEQSFLHDCMKSDRENYAYADSVINIIVDSIENSRNQLFRTLELLGTTQKRMEYIYSRIKLIENTAKLKLDSIKTDFDIDDEQIAQQIFLEYEQYKQQERKENKPQNAHDIFVNKYIVPKEEMQAIEEIQPKEKNIEKEYEDLPGDIII